MSGTTPCTSYWVGHRVHHIQALKAAKERGVPAELVEVEGTLIVLEVGGVERRFRNHDTSRLVAAIRERPRELVLVENWSLLRVEEGDSRPVFSIAGPDTPWRLCAPTRTRA